MCVIPGKSEEAGGGQESPTMYVMPGKSEEARGGQESLTRYVMLGKSEEAGGHKHCCEGQSLGRCRQVSWFILRADRDTGPMT